MVAAEVDEQGPVGGGGGIGEIVMVQAAVVVPAKVPVESTTWAVKLKGPAVVGVPVMAPVLVFSISTGGRTPTVMEKVYAGTPPVATRAPV